MMGDDGENSIDIVIVMPRVGEAQVPMVSANAAVHVHIADSDGNVHCDFPAMSMIYSAARGMTAHYGKDE